MFEPDGGLQSDDQNDQGDHIVLRFSKRRSRAIVRAPGALNVRDT